MSNNTRLIGLKLKEKSQWSQWSDLVETMLRGEDLWKHVGETPLRAAPLIENYTTEGEWQEAIDKHTARVYTARSAIVINLSPEVLDTIPKGITPDKVWQQLTNTYGGTGQHETYKLFTDFLALQFDGKDINKFCSQFKARIAAFHDTAVAVNNVQALVRLLQLVGPYYSTWASQERDKLRQLSDKDLAQINLEDRIGSLLDEASATLSEQTQYANLVKSNTSQGGQQGQGQHQGQRGRGQRGGGQRGGGQRGHGQTPRGSNNRGNNRGPGGHAGQTNQPQGSGDSLTCTHCGRANHAAATCWYKPGNEHLMPERLKNKAETAEGNGSQHNYYTTFNQPPQPQQSTEAHAHTPFRVIRVPRT